jgi:hypothetical protein
VNSKHKRKDGYWKYYHLAHTLERDAVVRNIASLVMENPPPCPEKKSRKGKKPVHSWEKMVCICILMVVFGLTSRDMQNVVPSLNLPWKGEPYPDHTWISRTFKKIPLQYLDDILMRSAYLCLRESGWRKGILGSDSSGIETDRYEYEERPVRKKKTFEMIRVKTYLKWHITAVLDHLVILSARTTSKKTGDSPVLRTMLNKLKKKYGVDLAGSIFDADMAYDSNDNCKSMFEMDIIPNIKQKENAQNRGEKMKYRRKASRMFNVPVYHYRGLIEGIFGAEETEHHQLYCRFRLEDNQERFGIIKAIGWNMEVLNRLQCANRLGIKVGQYAVSN